MMVIYKDNQGVTKAFPAGTKLRHVREAMGIEGRSRLTNTYTSDYIITKQYQVTGGLIFQLTTPRGE